MKPAGQTFFSSWLWPILVTGSVLGFLWFAASAQQEHLKLPRGERYAVRKNPRRKARHKARQRSYAYAA